MGPPCRTTELVDRVIRGLVMTPFPRSIRPSIRMDASIGLSSARMDPQRCRATPLPQQGSHIAGIDPHPSSMSPDRTNRASRQLACGRAIPSNAKDQR